MQGGLLAIFVAHGGSPQNAAESDLVAAVARARLAHPAIGLGDVRFVAHLARHVGKESDVAAALAALHIEDLFLACACVEGVDSALIALDASVIPRAMEYARRVDRRSSTVFDEVTQSLRVHMLVREPAREPAIASYGGRAPLEAWLRVAALREARMALRRVKDCVEPSEAEGVGPMSPEHQLLKQEGLAAMGASLEHVLGALDERERVLLRLYFVEGMSLANLGRIYHVHESTMARRLQALRGRIADAVKHDLATDTASLDSVLALVESQLDLHLSAVLRVRRRPQRS